jgi:hypothetical protein
LYFFLFFIRNEGSPPANAEVETDGVKEKEDLNGDRILLETRRKTHDRR